ncbi:MAG: sigma-54-dependent Fis family transcriptional regulator [Nitrospinae bacterium]|nr:sigma-54-dependent Fis family transcriptional regulator [Nitrospinota bacterium]
MADKINLLIVDDEEPFRQLLAERFTRQEFTVTACASGEEALSAAARQEFDVGVLDIRMSGISGIDLFRKVRESHPLFEAIILTGQASLDSAIEAMKLGAYDYLAKPCKLFELELIIRKAYEKKMLALENLRLKNRLSVSGKSVKIAGKSAAANEVRAMIAKIAPSGAPVLITGETGAGKDYAAMVIHQSSQPKDAPFISVSCGAIPHGMLEAQLFGYEKDAFTGAATGREGWLEIANGGTVLLENVEELHPSSQVKLHRFLETGTFQRAGGSVDIRSNVRIIATTQSDLRELVLKKAVREDLYYRLSVVTLHMPPLRERKEDIPAIIDQFLEDSSEHKGKKFSVKAVNAMLKYDWPGNIRELLNVVERAALLSPKSTIQAKDVPLSLEKKSKSTRLRHLMSMSEVEKEHILYVLGASGGNISRASRVLGISRPKLYRKIEQYKSGAKSA